MYSKTVMDHFNNPRNAGRPQRFDARGVAGNPEGGPFMIMYLTLSEGGTSIKEARFETYGCGPAIAAGSVLTEMVKGVPPFEAAAIGASSLLEALGGLPLGKRHCAELAIGALRRAVEGCRQEPSARRAEEL